MNYVRTQDWARYVPRTIGKDFFKSLVEALDQFKPGLETTSRKLKAKAISRGKITELEGNQAWKVTDSHSLPEIEHLQVELLLTENEKQSCELHIEFRAEHIFISVSDIGTDWGKSVVEEAAHLLRTMGISLRDWKDIFRKSYSILEILQNLLLVFSAFVFSAWLTNSEELYLYSAIGFLISGSVPTLKKLFYFFKSPKKISVIQETVPKKRRLPWLEASAVISFLVSVLSLVKELVSVLFS